MDSTNESLQSVINTIDGIADIADNMREDAIDKHFIINALATIKKKAELEQIKLMEVE